MQKTRRMNILLVSAEYPPESPGGLGNAMRNLAVGLSAQGANPVILSSLEGSGPSVTNPDPENSPDGFTVYRIHKKKKRLKREPGWFWRFHDFYLPLDCYLYSKSISKACCRIIAEEKINVVQFPDYKGEGYHFIGQGSNIPSVVRLATPLYMVERINRASGIPAGGESGACRKAAMKFMKHLELKPIKKASGIVSPSESLADMVAEDTNPEGRIEIIPTGTDTSKFKPMQATDAARYKESLGLKDEPAVLFTGRYEYRKGAHILIEAFAEVKRAAPDCVLLLAGGDTDTAPSGGSMKLYLQSLSESLNLKGSVFFLDRIEHGQLPLLYSSASVFAAPSLYENFANTIMEAMACGLPVITTTSGGGPEMIKDPENGRLIPPGDKSALAGAILELLSDTEACKIIGGANVDKARSRFSRETMAHAFLKLYESLI